MPRNLTRRDVLRMLGALAVAAPVVAMVPSTEARTLPSHPVCDFCDKVLVTLSDLSEFCTVAKVFTPRRVARYEIGNASKFPPRMIEGPGLHRYQLPEPERIRTWIGKGVAYATLDLLDAAQEHTDNPDELERAELTYQRSMRGIRERAQWLYGDAGVAEYKRVRALVGEFVIRMARNSGVA